MVEAEMRKAFVPWPGDTPLDRARIGGIARDRVDIALGQPATEPLDRRRLSNRPVVGAGSRDFNQTWWNDGPDQSVNPLTL